MKKNVMFFFSESEEEEEERKKSAQLLFEDTHIIFEAETPHLATLFEGSTKVLKGHLNALLLEISKVMGNKSNAVDFEYRNGNKPCCHCS
jgi:hypothetical protein